MTTTTAEVSRWGDTPPVTTTAPRARGLARILDTTSSSAPLIARVALGVVMFPHGAQKMFGWFGGGGLAATTQGMGQMGVPAFVVFLVALVESFGALALIAGFLVRPVVLGLAIVQLGAVWLVHAQYGFFMNWMGAKSGEGTEFAILAIGACLALLVWGGGKASIDHFLSRRRYEKAAGV